MPLVLSENVRSCLFGLLFCAAADQVLSQHVGLLDHRIEAYVEFSSPVYRISEDQSEAVVTVTRAGEFREPVTVQYATRDGTAHAGLDYIATSGTLVIPAGAGMATFTVPITADKVPESTETLHIFLLGTSFNGLITQGSAVLAIHDGDTVLPTAAPSLTVASNREGQILIRWPVIAAACVLERADSPVADHWEAVSASAQVMDGHCTVVEVPSGERFFYRLRGVVPVAPAGSGQD